MGGAGRTGVSAGMDMGRVCAWGAAAPGLELLQLRRLLHVQAEVLGEAAVLLQDALRRHVQPVHHLRINAQIPIYLSI